MNKYETIMILKNDINQNEKEKIIEKIVKYISQHGTIIEKQDLGEKKLAYEVRRYQKGYYYIIKFQSEEQNLGELERIYRITDEILKYIIVREI